MHFQVAAHAHQPGDVQRVFEVEKATNLSISSREEAGMRAGGGRGEVLLVVAENTMDVGACSNGEWVKPGTGGRLNFDARPAKSGDF